CAIGVLGLLLLAAAPNAFAGMVAVLVVDGVCSPVTRWVSVIWLNRRSTSDVRATVHSFMSQAEYVGEVSLGLGLGVIGQLGTIGLGMRGWGALRGLAGVRAVLRSGEDD